MPTIKKQIKSHLLLSIFFIVILACTSKEIVNIYTYQLTGTLVVVGNEPFTSYAIEEVNHNITRIKVNESQVNQIKDLQGKIIQVYGNDMSDLDELIVQKISK